MKLRPMLQVADVEGSSRWYQSCLGLRSGHGGPEFEMLFDGDEFVLQLHLLGACEHGILQAGTTGERGWERRCGSRRAIVRSSPLSSSRRGAGAEIVEEPRWNPLAHHHEATLRDPDGYVVVICTPFSAEP